MSMVKIDALNQKIIAQSVQKPIVQTDLHKKTEGKEKKEGFSDSGNNYKIAAAAVASIAVAGILIANRNKIGRLFKGKAVKNESKSSVVGEVSKPLESGKTQSPKTEVPQVDNPKPIVNEQPQSPKTDIPQSDNPKTVDKEQPQTPKTDEPQSDTPKSTDESEKASPNGDDKNPELNSDDGIDIINDSGVYTPPQPKLIDKIIPYDENYERLRREKEAPIKEKIEEIFKRYRDDKESAPEFNQYRVQNVIFPEHVSPRIKADLRELEQEDFDAVLSFLENYQYNAKMRAGIDVSDVDEVKRLNRLIDEAEPLENDTYVYRAIRTNELWGEHKEYEFAKDMEIGDTLKDRAFVATSRSYDVDIAGADPKNWEERLQNYGMIMRIRLPKGTKGLDCRRCSMVDSDRGANAVYILPAGSEFKIRAYDYPRRILSCDYILPNS